ncbi:MAG: uroporphyrinogen decarboxylase family protein [Lentisphaeria bacterium]|jgi:uroporphyrinogen decarboxylase
MTTPRENLLRALRRQGFETVPLDSNAFCASQLEAFKKRFGHEDYQRWFGNPFRGVGLPMTRTFADPKALYPRETPPADTTFDDWGIGHSRQPNCYHMTRMHHPLAGDAPLAEIQNYPLPVIAPDGLARVRARVAEIQGRGLAVMGDMPCTVWETAWYLRSMEDLMADMMGDDDRATTLLDRITALACARAATYAEAGCDLIQLGDDIGMQQTIMMSLDLWRNWLKPRLAKVIAAARAVKPDVLIFYHSCGYVLPFIGELADVGVDILNPVQPECMDFAEVHRQFGDRISFWSTIGTQSTLPFGTPAEVRAAVERNLRICGAKGGIVIGPTHMVEPEVPWENLVALKEACEQFRL